MWLVGVATVVTGIGSSVPSTSSPRPGQRATDALAFIVAVCGAALLLRRRWPFATLTIVTAGLAVYILREYPGGPVYLAGLVALFSFASARERRVGYLAAVVMVLYLGGLRYAVDPGLGVDDVALAGLSAAAVLATDSVAWPPRQRAARSSSAGWPRIVCRSPRPARQRRSLDGHDQRAGGRRRTRHRTPPQQAAAALEAIRVAGRDVLTS